MSEWRGFRLGSIATFSYGTMPKKEKLGKGQYPTFSGYKYQYQYLEYNCEKGDLIVVARGVGGTGDVKIVKEKCYLTNLSIKINLDKSKLDNQFFYYNYAIETLRYLDSGSAQSQITINDLSKILIVIPTLSEQKAIAAVLSSLDDKIDLLHRQNKTLEAMAETLFKQWFVVEAREDWEEGFLGDIASFHNGKKRPDDIIGGNIPIYGGNGILGYSDNFNYEGTTIIVGRVGAYCGSLYIEYKPIWISDNALVAKPINDKYSSFLFFLLKNLSLNEMAEGSSHPLLTQTLLKSIQITLPNCELIESFVFQVDIWLNKINFNNQQIQTLETLRDNLLPKLMSGDVRVKYND